MKLLYLTIFCVFFLSCKFDGTNSKTIEANEKQIQIDNTKTDEVDTLVNDSIVINDPIKNNR